MLHFRFAFGVTFLCLLLAGFWGYSHGGLSHALNALIIVVILGVMEISLSFDNAVVNASVLKHWSAFWQNLFLTVGIVVAVFGVRMLLPLWIVALSADLSLPTVWHLALYEPREYAQHLTLHHAQIAAFGGMFLLMVFLKFFLDENKDVHWFGFFERRPGRLGAHTPHDGSEHGPGRHRGHR